MESKDYFLSLLKSPFLTQFDIPSILLQDNEIISLIMKYKWLINTNIGDYDWTHLTKMRAYSD
jgi:hypothetical protein